MQYPSSQRRPATSSGSKKGGEEAGADVGRRPPPPRIAGEPAAQRAARRGRCSTPALAHASSPGLEAPASRRSRPWNPRRGGIAARTSGSARALASTWASAPRAIRRRRPAAARGCLSSDHGGVNVIYPLPASSYRINARDERGGQARRQISAPRPTIATQRRQIVSQTGADGGHDEVYFPSLEICDAQARTCYSGLRPKQGYRTILVPT